MKLKSITDFQIMGSIYQIQLIKGFKYIDKAGELVNRFWANGRPPQFKMGLDGLELQNTKKNVDTIRYSSKDFWIKFKDINTIDQVLQIIKEPLEILHTVQEVETVSRIGWRNVFLLELSQPKDISHLEKILSISSSLKTVEVKLFHSAKDIKAVIQLEILLDKDNSSKKALQVNVDTFVENETETSCVLRKTSEMMQYLKNDLPAVLNELLVGGTR